MAGMSSKATIMGHVARRRRSGRSGVRSSTFVGAIAFVLGCGDALGDAAGGVGSALASVTGRRVRFEVRSAPEQPPVRGACSFTLDASDPPSGAPLDGLVLSVEPWMPAMGHGTGMEPLVSALGEGSYVIDEVMLFMPGTWELRIDVEFPDGGEEHVDIAVPVR